MASREAALRALHAQADFQVVDKGGELAAAVTRSADAGRRLRDASAQRLALLEELRRLQGAAALNPATIESLRRVYRLAVERESATRHGYDRAAQAEDELREALATLRHRARHLERAARDEAATTASLHAVREGARLDDLWLAGKRRSAT